MNTATQESQGNTAKRTMTLVQAALNAGDSNPDTNTFQWLQDAWELIQDRIEWHLNNGRTKQARAWSDASNFFAARYAGQFIAY